LRYLGYRKEISLNKYVKVAKLFTANCKLIHDCPSETVFSCVFTVGYISRTQKNRREACDELPVASIYRNGIGSDFITFVLESLGANCSDFDCAICLGMKELSRDSM